MVDDCPTGITNMASQASNEKKKKSNGIKLKTDMAHSLTHLLFTDKNTARMELFLIGFHSAKTYYMRS